MLKIALALLAASGLLGAEEPFLTFAATGDMRVDPVYEKELTADLIPQDVVDKYRKDLGEAVHDPAGKPRYPFYFNYWQTRQNLADLAALHPKYFFILGDLVMGFGKDGGGSGRGSQPLKAQLDAFAAVLKGEPGPRDCRIVPLPGNHETTFKIFLPNGTKPSGVDAGDARTWRLWLEENHYAAPGGGNGPGVGALISAGGPKLQEDQKDVTYSFDTPDGSVHFVVLNTDVLTDQKSEEGGYETLGLVPLDWLEKDLDAAEHNPRIKHVFVISHKPIQPPSNFVPDPPDKVAPSDSLSPQVSTRLLDMLCSSQRHAKVRALICSHAHLWCADRLEPKNAAHTHPIWQVVAGNAGTRPEKFWRPAGGQFFGFTFFKVYPSGKVTLNSYQRPCPGPGTPAAEPCYAASKWAVPAQPRPQDLVLYEPGTVH